MSLTIRVEARENQRVGPYAVEGDHCKWRA